MLKDRSDIFYGARLVADARLHLGAVINGGDGELFFTTMWKIIDNKFYLGYRTFDNREIKMGGVKDFIFNFHHGLGIKKVTLATFLANCAKADHIVRPTQEIVWYLSITKKIPTI